MPADSHPGTFFDYDCCCRSLIAEFGASRHVLDLRPADFEKHYAHLSRQYGVGTLGREITIRRSLFRYCHHTGRSRKWRKLWQRFM
jgi:hypothetical protein